MNLISSYIELMYIFKLFMNSSFFHSFSLRLSGWSYLCWRSFFFFLILNGKLTKYFLDIVSLCHSYLNATARSTSYLIFMVQFISILYLYLLRSKAASILSLVVGGAANCHELIERCKM